MTTPEPRAPAPTEADEPAGPASGAAIERMPLPGTFAFVGSGCLLVIELVAGRIVAPTIGVSLYTWTSVIGVVLGGIALGNYLGGRIADRRPGRTTLSNLYFLSAGASALILLFARDPNAVAAPTSLPAILQVLWLVGVMFFLPSVLLGTVTPMLVKLSLRSLGATGRVVGRIQAAATLGSIVGTFATGFFLISWFGTRAIVGGVAVAVFLLGVLSSPRWTRVRVLGAALALALIGTAAIASASGCLRESNYYCIRVERLSLQQLQRLAVTQPGLVHVPAGTSSDIRVMILDHLAHGFVDLEHPTNLIYGYERLYAGVLQKLHPYGASIDSLFLGGGTYTFPRFVRARYDGDSLVAEIDPEVTEVAEQYFGLRLSRRLRVDHRDARIVLRDMPSSERFDAVFGDVFNDFSVPYHLTTREFNDLVARHMRTDGVYVVNLVDGVRYDFLRSYVRTLRLTFRHVQVLTVTGAWPPNGMRQTFVVAASDAPLPELGATVSDADLQRFESSGTSVLLTDDHVPVDQLLAPVFRQRLES